MEYFKIKLTVVIRLCDCFEENLFYLLLSVGNNGRFENNR